MAKGKNKKPKQATQDGGLQFIKNAIETKTISRSEVETMAAIDYPLFSFRYFKDVSFALFSPCLFIVDPVLVLFTTRPL